MTKEKAKNRIPFTMHSSSATGGYHDRLDKFKSGVDITNLHVDTYGDFKDAPMQGPFTQKYVGGHQRRHQGIVLAGDFEIVRSSIWEETPLLVTPLEDVPTVSGSNDQAWEVEILDGDPVIRPMNAAQSNSIWEVVSTDIMPMEPGKDFFQVQKRGEAFYIIPVDGGLRIYGADYRGTNYPRAVYYRDEFAKRPVNIRNIASNTGSGPFEGPGNFDHNYEVVQTTGRTTNPRHFAESVESYQKFQERKGFEGNVFNTTGSTTGSHPGYLRNFALPTRTKHKSVIVNRFSAPGDRYTMSRGFLNPSGEELSVYNAIPFRNESVRISNNLALSRHMDSYGYEMNGEVVATGSDGRSIPSGHKVNKNRLRVIKQPDIGSHPVTGSQYDNYYVQHPIPRSDLAYSWITGSITGSTESSLYGYQQSSTDIDFPIIARKMTNLGNYDSNTSTTALSFPVDSASATAGIGTTASFGFSSWEQIRKHDSQHARYLRDSNTFSFLTGGNKDPAKTTSVTQPPVTIKYKPIKQEVLLRNDPSGTTYEMVSTLSNDLEFFSEQKNVNVESLLGLSNEEKETFYEKLKKLYIDPDPDLEDNPIREVSRITYGERIYPPDRFSGLKENRTRENYIETSGAMDTGINQQYGKQSNFYHPTTMRNEGARNSFNFTPNRSTLDSTTTSYTFDSGIPADFTSDGTSGVKQDTNNARYAFVFGDQTTANVSARYLQYMKTVSGEVSISFEYIKGTYGGLGLENPDGTEDLVIQYRVSDTSPWITAKAVGASGNVDAMLDSDDDGSDTAYTSFIDTMKNSDNLNDNTYTGKLGTTTGANFPAGTQLRIAQLNFSGYQYDNWAIFGLSITAATVSKEKESLALFPLRTDGAKSFPHLTTYSKNIGELVHDTDESAYGDDPIPSPCFVEYTNINISSSTGYVLSDYVERLTETISGRTPGPETYEDFREDFRPQTKTKSLLPEFRISEHIDEYLSDLRFTRPPAEYFTLQGGKDSKGDIRHSKKDSFFDKHMTTEPMSRIREVVEDHSDMDIAKIKIKCKAIKKLLPYNGFFPVTRTTQIANEFSSSFAENIKGYRDGTTTPYPKQGLQAISKAFMSPGILYNSIKAGYAVDYPVYTGSVPTTNVITEAGLNPQRDFALSSAPDYRLPFETLYNAKGNLPEDTSIRFTPSYVSTEPISPTFPYYATWTGKSRPNYQLAMHNFLAESVDFFLENGTLNYFVSKPEAEFEEFEAGKEYYMDVVLKDNLKMDNFAKYTGNVHAQGGTFINEGGAMSDFFSGSDGYYATVFAHGSKADQKPNRITLYRNKLDAVGWEQIDRITFNDDSTADQHRAICSASGSSEAYVAIGNPMDYTYGIEGSVRVYKIKNNKFQTTFDAVTSSVHKPPGTVRRLYGYGNDVKIVAADDGYHLVTGDSANGAVPITIYPDGGRNREVSASFNTASNSGVLFLYSSSSSDGLKERNIFHNILPGGQSANNARLAYPGTYELINLNFVDDPTATFPSSSMNGVLIVAGTGRHNHPNSPTNTTSYGGMCLFYSGSNYGTGSAYFYNKGEYPEQSNKATYSGDGFYQPTSSVSSFGTVSSGSTAAGNAANGLSHHGHPGDLFGSTVAACMNGTAPYQKFYIAASTASKNLQSGLTTTRQSGSIHLFTGSIHQNFVDVTDASGEVTGSVPTGSVNIDFFRTQVIDKLYLNESGLDASGIANEFGEAGQLHNTEIGGTGWGIGSTLSMESSRHDAGVAPQIFLAFGSPYSRYHDPLHPTRVSQGSFFVIEMSGTGVAQNQLTILPTELLPGMSSDYRYGDTVIRNNGRGRLKIISGSGHPYNSGDDLCVFTSPRNSYDNYLSTDTSGKDFVVMFTGSTWRGVNSYSGRNDATGSLRTSAYLPPNFSASLDIRVDFEYNQDGKLYGLPLEYPHDPAYCAYTPPSYYGQSIARLSFKPDVTGKYSLSEILNQAQVESVSNIDEDKSALFSTIDRRNRLTAIQEKASMKVESSVDLMGRTSVPLTEFDLLEGGESTTPKSVQIDTSKENQQWVISTKYESPILDFSSTKTEHNSLYASHLQSATDAHGFTGDSTFDSPRAMWLSYGVVPSDEKGIFLELKESFSPDVYQNEENNKKSLISATGFTADSKKMGKIGQTKEIKEAICIIPYTKSTGGNQSFLSQKYIKQYQSTDRPLVIVPRFNTSKFNFHPSRLGVFSSRKLMIDALRGRVQFANDHDLVKIDRGEFEKQKKTFEESNGKLAVLKEDSITGEEIRETSISRMIRGLKEYVVPPHLDPLYSSYVKDPFAMYFAEVSHELDTEDLSNIWQNISPDISLNFENAEIDISHDIDKHNFFSSSEEMREHLKRDMSFIVFKVKKRAKINYFETTKDTTDDTRFKFNLKGGQQEVVPEYSYNWPYDFFSLIESADLSMEVELEKPTPPPPPPPITRRRRRRRRSIMNRLKNRRRARRVRDVSKNGRKHRGVGKRDGNPYSTRSINNRKR